MTGGSSVTQAGWDTFVGPAMPEEVEGWVARHIVSSPGHGRKSELIFTLRIGTLEQVSTFINLSNIIMSSP